MAAQNVSGQVNLTISMVETVTAGLITPIQAAAQGSIPATIGALINGTGATQAVDTLYAAQLTLAASVTTLNLHTGLTDPLGNAIAFARVRLWFVQVVTATAGFICNIYTLTGTDPLTWLPLVTTGTLWCPPSGVVMGFDPASTTTNGYVVSASHFSFSLDPGANTVVCNVIIAGNSAA